jgi:glyoxylase-like metal-dependent hydrolase (beta-lactamase superfamily II)
MYQVAPDIFRIERLRAANVFVIASPDGLTLVDAGLVHDAGRILEQIEAAGHALSSVRALVLTHGHEDHEGGSARIIEATGAKVFAHAAEVPLIERTAHPSTVRQPRRLLSRIAGTFLPKGQPCKVDVALEDGDEISGTGGYRVVHTPGHTPGSMCLYHPARRILFCGDAIFNIHPVTGRRGLRAPIAMFTADPAKARDSIVRLAALDVNQLYPGHGEPVLEGAGDRIRELSSRLG